MAKLPGGDAEQPRSLDESKKARKLPPLAKSQKLQHVEVPDSDPEDAKPKPAPLRKKSPKPLPVPEIQDREHVEVPDSDPEDAEPNVAHLKWSVRKRFWVYGIVGFVAIALVSGGVYAYVSGAIQWRQLMGSSEQDELHIKDVELYVSCPSDEYQVHIKADGASMIFPSEGEWAGAEFSAQPKRFPLKGGKKDHVISLELIGREGNHYKANEQSVITNSPGEQSVVLFRDGEDQSKEQRANSVLVASSIGFGSSSFGQGPLLVASGILTHPKTKRVPMARVLIEVAPRSQR